MKCIYLFFYLLLASVTSATAQNVDMQLSQTYPMDGFVMISVKESPANQTKACAHNDYYFSIKNLGPDNIGPNDSAVFGFPMFNLWSRYSLSRIGGLALGSELFQHVENIKMTYESLGLTESGISVQNVCDTLWMVDANGDVIYDPDLSNNHICNDVSLSTWFLDVADINKTNGFSMYPNPAATQLNLVSTFNNAKVVNVVIRDMIGKTILTQNLGTNLNGQQTFGLDISNLIIGNYVIELNVDGSRSPDRYEYKNNLSDNYL
jgi:hypothetical protein